MNADSSKKTPAETPSNVPAGSGSVSPRFVRTNLIFFFVVATIGLVLDLVTKSWVFRALGMPREYRWHEEPDLNGIYWLWKDVVGFQTSLNEGALFGMGQGKIGYLIPLAGVALIGIGFWVFHSAKQSRFLSLTLGMIVAGILGNLYDRIGLHHMVWNYANDLHKIGDPVFAVRDWILVMLGSYPWPNFNIADSLLVCGACLMVLHSFLYGEDDKPTTPSNPKNGDS